MAHQELEKRYDLLVTGTDLTSSLIAAAASRIGKTVLHLDPYDCYGQEWASLKLFDLLAAPAILIKDYKASSTLQKCVPPSLISNVTLETPVFETTEACTAFFADFTRASDEAEAGQLACRFTGEFLPKLKSVKTAQEAKEVLSQLKEELGALNGLDNAFSVDLTPRFIFSRGEMVDILIRSNVTRYLEFRKIARILTPLIQRDSDQPENDPNESKFKLMNVPCTRSDVFKCTAISMVEKRLLMRFLDFIKSAKQEESKQEPQINQTRPFSLCLAEQKLTPKLVDLIVNSVLMNSPEMSTGEALAKIRRFMFAIGRFADRPYLIPTYGTDDLVQAFCRYAAIYGATYCLSCLVTDLGPAEVTKIPENPEEAPENPENRENTQMNQNLLSVTISSQTEPILVAHLVTNYVFPCLKMKPTSGKASSGLSRAILCSRVSICSDGLGEVDNTSVLYLPAELTGDAQGPVYVFETDKSTNACPKGLYIQFFWCKSTGPTAVDDLKGVIEKVYNAAAGGERARPLWSLYYNQATEIEEYDDALAPNLHRVSPPINELDYDAVVKEARTLFERMFPGEEFFPQTSEPTGEEGREEEEEEHEMEVGNEVPETKEPETEDLKIEDPESQEPETKEEEEKKDPAINGNNNQ